MVTDRDSDTDNNNKFDLKLISVTPTPQDLEFYLEQRGKLGILSFKGCLDHEVIETGERSILSDGKIYIY